MDEVFVMGLAAYITELAKKRGMGKEWIPLAMLLLCAGLNLSFAALFKPEQCWQDALRNGLAMGAVAGGIYGFGKAVKRKTNSSEKF